MFVRFGYEIEIVSNAPVPILAALNTHSTTVGRLVGYDFVRSTPEVPTHEYLDRFGNRIARLTAPAGSVRLWSDCIVEMEEVLDPFEPFAQQHAIEDLPDDVLQYLSASRYCDSDNLTAFAWAQFGQTQPGWARVQAIVDYVHRETTFGYKFGRGTKTASDVRVEKTGVCRDFAHLAITLCRAMNFPARYVSGYLGDIGIPRSGAGDFCAWFEVWLGGQWHVFDARYNARRIGRLPMVRGADAADVAMITSFGQHRLTFFRVWTDRLDDGLDDAAMLNMLATRPDAEALVFPSSGRAA